MPPTLQRIAITSLAVSLLSMTTPGPAGASSDPSPEKPARLEPISGTPLRRVILTEKAAKRIDVRTEVVRGDPSGRLLVPYQALFYDLKGDAWVYTNPEALSFVRHRVSVIIIEMNDTVVLREGPPAGTRVVTLGVAELHGTESGVDH